MTVHAVSTPRTKTKRRTHVEDLEPPAVPIPHEAEDRADVVAKDDLHEEPAVDEPRALEDLFVLRELVFGRELGGRLVMVGFVDRVDLLRDVLEKG